MNDNNRFAFATSRGAFAAAVVLTMAMFAAPAAAQTPKEVEAAQINTQLGIAYLKQGNLQVAQEKLERAAKQNPKDPNVHTALALLYERLERPKDVDSHYRTALRLAPNNPDVANNYAVYLCKNKRPDEGVKRFADAARNPLYKTPEVAYTNAGVCLRAAKRLDDARAYFQRALAVRPNFAEAVYQLSDLDYERGRYGDARANVDKYLGSFQATPDLLLLGVRVARALGDRLGEERYAKQLRAEFPDSDQVRALAELKRNPG